MNITSRIVLLQKGHAHAQAVQSRIGSHLALTCADNALQAFDELLLMKRGGRIIFFGETGYRSQKLVEYFEVRSRIPCTPCATCRRVSGSLQIVRSARFVAVPQLLN